jgi:hypothetical protein
MTTMLTHSRNSYEDPASPNGAIRADIKRLERAEAELSVYRRGLQVLLNQGQNEALVAQERMASAQCAAINRRLGELCDQLSRQIRQA